MLYAYNSGNNVIHIHVHVIQVIMLCTYDSGNNVIYIWLHMIQGSVSTEYHLDALWLEHIISSDSTPTTSMWACSVWVYIYMWACSVWVNLYVCIVSDSSITRQILDNGLSEKADWGGYKNGYPIAIFTLAILALFCVTINFLHRSPIELYRYWLLYFSSISQSG